MAIIAMAATTRSIGAALPPSLSAGRRRSSGGRRFIRLILPPSLGRRPQRAPAPSLRAAPRRRWNGWRPAWLRGCRGGLGDRAARRGRRRSRRRAPPPRRRAPARPPSTPAGNGGTRSNAGRPRSASAPLPQDRASHRRLARGRGRLDLLLLFLPLRRPRSRALPAGLVPASRLLPPRDLRPRRPPLPGRSGPWV